MEVLEFLDNSGDVLIKRLPEAGQLEIKWGSQLTVRESQEAVFFRDGQALEVFGPGRHVLQTQNIPVITKWVTSFGYGPNSPFRSEVIFVGKQLFPNLKWGTSEPILFKDSDFSILRLRSYGSYSFLVNDSLLFVNKLAGTRGVFTTDGIKNYLKGIIISKVNAVLSRDFTSILEIGKKIEDLNVILKSELHSEFSGLGLKIHDFFIQSITVPEEVQQMIDIRSGIGAIGNLDQYMKFKVANAIGDSAQNNGSTGNAFNTGAGLALGMLLPQMINLGINPSGKDSKDSVDKIRMLKELLEMGAITQAEFESKKAALLNEI